MAFQVGTQLVQHNPTISPKGSPGERLWIIADAPLPRDKEKGYLFSSAMGWSYDKMLIDVGITRYYACVAPNPTEARSVDTFVNFINKYQPPIIVALDGAGQALLSQLTHRESVNKWAGSLLQSDKLNYPHYIIPTHGPEKCIQDWTERQVVKYIDYGKIKGELDFWTDHGNLQPLPNYTLEYELDKDFPRLLDKLSRWRDPGIKYLSIDVESIYPREKSEYYGHPGYPITVGIAPNPKHGISFELFRESTKETGLLWRAIATLVEDKEIIGQNFHSFDAWHFDMLGMGVNRRKIHDTRHMHAVLWPELSHKLEFLTRQYTRQPYYKSEGHHWGPKDMTRLKRYNCLDVVTTYQVFFGMEEELNDRPHLR